MQNIWFLMLVALAVQASAKRVQVHKRVQAQKAEVAQAKVEKAEIDEVEKAEIDEVANATESSEKPEAQYWDSHKGEWEFVAAGLVNNEVTQQFKLKEDYRFMRTKKYKAQLDQFEDAHTGIEIRKKIKAKVLTVTNYFWTMHAHQEAIFKTEHGDKIGDYQLFNPHFINRRYTWRVAKSDDPDKVLFTIQKRLYNDHCKYMGWFSCKPVLKIYVGRRGDKSTLIYYGVGDKDLDEPDFKFYHSEAAYKANKRAWVGKVDHKKHAGDSEDTYKVKVKPGEDAGLLLLASVCLDKVGDDNRAAQPSDDHDD